MYMSAPCCQRAVPRPTCTEIAPRGPRLRSSSSVRFFPVCVVRRVEHGNEDVAPGEEAAGRVRYARAQQDEGGAHVVELAGFGVGHEALSMFMSTELWTTPKEKPFRLRAERHCGALAQHACASSPCVAV